MRIFYLFFPTILCMKKKICLIVFILLIIIVASLFLPKQQNGYDYLRLHIRANSNLSIDQNVKYEIKNKVVEFLTPYLCTVESKESAMKIINNLTPALENTCNSTLKKNGFGYVANVKISNEYFPTRTYVNTTLESGYYDAVIIELGEAKGDNWWCVMYPPLCFVNKNENNMQIKYESKVWEWLKSIFG